MARSTYIYLIRNAADDTVLGAFTVKHEVHTFAKKGPYDWEQCYLTRMRDGGGVETEVEIPWEFNEHTEDGNRPTVRGWPSATENLG